MNDAVSYFWICDIRIAWLFSCIEIKKNTFYEREKEKTK